MRLAELAEQHGDELSPTGKPAHVTFSGVLPHGLLELTAGEQLQQL
jgi:hypothetical protein